MRRIIKVSDLKCDGCITRIEQGLGGINGINSVVGNMDDKEVIVDFDEKAISINEIKKIIAEIGYTPSRVVED